MDRILARIARAIRSLIRRTTKEHRYVFRRETLAPDARPARRHGGRHPAGLLALAAGIARYVFLGLMLARVFDGAPWNDWAWPAAGAALMVLLRSQLDHWRTVQAQRASAAIQLRCAAGCTTASWRWDRPGSRASAPAG